MVGFERESEMLIEQLVTGPRQLDVISIVGMPGLGKTTLAKRLYEHETLSNRFDVRMFCCSSQHYDKRAVLSGLLDHICELDNRTKRMSNDELADKLYKCLKGKRYLAIVDDVWSPEAWDDIRRSFPDDNNGSRIILTTRLESIATYAMIYSRPHYLRLFQGEESWMLMKEKIFKEDVCPQELEEIGKQVAAKCRGLPLAILLVAGLLTKQDKEAVWQDVGKTLKSKIEGCMDIVEASYQHLPVHLQNCFLYFASFKEDEVVLVRKLIRLWIAEGFVEANTSKSLEMVAIDYLMELINSNLVMIAKTNSFGELQAIQTHDLLHEFCLVKAKTEDFLRTTNGIPPWHPNNNCGRLSISAPRKVVFLDDSRSLRGDIRSIRFQPSDYPPFVDFRLSVFWPHLTVLDLGHANLCQKTISSLPKMMHLRYLELHMYFLKIPDWIINFNKLETLIITGEYGHDCIPITIWDLPNLRHLHISPLYILREEFEDLDNLQTCSDLVVFPGIDYQKFMKRFPNLLKLKCLLYVSGKPLENFFPGFCSLSQLKSLKIDVSGVVVDPYGFEDFTYPENLKKLTLACLELPWSKISTISRLSNLEVLKLEGNAFRGRKWDVKDGEFPNLKVLKLRKLEISEWTASDDSFPSLQQVRVRSCWELKELPDSFGSSCSMQLIEVRACRVLVVRAAYYIKKQQIEEMGNSEFKMICWQCKA